MSKMLKRRGRDCCKALNMERRLHKQGPEYLLEWHGNMHYMSYGKKGENLFMATDPGDIEDLEKAKLERAT